MLVLLQFFCQRTPIHWAQLPQLSFSWHEWPVSRARILQMIAYVQTTAAAWLGKIVYFRTRITILVAWPAWPAVAWQELLETTSYSNVSGRNIMDIARIDSTARCQNYGHDEPALKLDRGVRFQIRIVVTLAYPLPMVFETDRCQRSCLMRSAQWDTHCWAFFEGLFISEKMNEIDAPYQTVRLYKEKEMINFRELIASQKGNSNAITRQLQERPLPRVSV